MGWRLRKPLSSLKRVQVKHHSGTKIKFSHLNLKPESYRGGVGSVALSQGEIASESDFRLYPQKGQASEPCYVSVILPLYNERACIHRTFAAVLEYAECHPFYQFIFVNDGSTDETARILEAKLAAAKTFQIKLIAYDRRCGKGYAIRKGIEFAGGDYVCFLDSDLAYSLDHLEPLFEQLKLFDVVIGCRNKIPGGPQGVKPSRKLAGKVFNLLSQWILGLKFNDMQAGLKGFRRQAAQTLFGKQTLMGFSFDVELIYLAKKLNYQIGEIPARVSLEHGKKASNVKLFQDSLRMFLDLLQIRFNDWMGRYE